MSLRLASLLILSALLPGVLPAEPFKPHEVAVEKEMLITALEVVGSPEANYPGVWSFGHLLDEAYGPEESRKIVAQWLENWAKGTQPAPFSTTPAPVPGRENLDALVIAPWKLRDGYREGQKEPWLPNLSNAPFRLLAIVNRMDIAKRAEAAALVSTTPTYYTDTENSFLANADGGEARFVFGAVDSRGEPLAGGMTLIFEYGLDAPLPGRVTDWARAWHKLGEHQAFDAAYRAELSKFTRLVTNKRPKTESRSENTPRKTDLHERLWEEAASESRQLLRIRSNDGACGKLREFRQFNAATVGLVAARLPGTPDDVFFAKGSKENRWLAGWIEEQRVAPKEVRDRFQPGQEIPASLKTEIPTAFALPLNFGSGRDARRVSGFVATVVNNDKKFHWEGWGLRDEALRRNFSVQTCCGCHCGDTGTEFFHVAPRRVDELAPVSKFLRTDGSKLRLKDAANGRSFESSEIEDRKLLYLDVLSPGLSRAEIKRLTGARAGFVH